MSDVIDLNSRRKQTEDSSISVQEMLLTLEKQYNILKEMLESGADHLDVTISQNSTLEFTPKSLMVVIGNGETVLTSGVKSLTAIEALGLRQKIKRSDFRRMNVNEYKM